MSGGSVNEEFSDDEYEDDDEFDAIDGKQILFKIKLKPIKIQWGINRFLSFFFEFSFSDFNKTTKW